VLVWHTDRLHRSPRELEEYVTICERRKVTTQTVKAGELDLATPSGRAVARTLGAWARFEVEHKSERTKRAQLQAAQAGKWLGGSRPFGWTVRDDGSAILNRPEAREVRNAAKSLLAGMSLGSIVADLNRRGVTTSTGRTWSYTSIRQVLTRPRNAGLIELNGDIVARSPWSPLLTEDTWRAVCGLLNDPGRRRSQSNRARWLLAGIATCGVCGAVLRSATVVNNRARVASRRTVYRCKTPGPGHVARAAEPLDELVSGVIAERLARPDIADLLAADGARPDTEGLRTEAVALRLRLGEASDSFADGRISRPQLEKITRRVNERLADVEAALAASARGSVFGGIIDAADPVRAWTTAGIDRQRAIVRELVTVTVLATGRRGRGFNPAFVQINWKAGL